VNSKLLLWRFAALTFVQPLVLIFTTLFASIALAGVSLTQPSVANGEYVNGVTFSVNVTSDIVRVELSAGGFGFGSLNATNNWTTRYNFTNLGNRTITAQGFNAAGTVISTSSITINVVDIVVAQPFANAEFLNGTPITVNASDRVSQVVVAAETFEIGRTSSRNPAGQFIVQPVIMGTIGARTLNVTATLANGSVVTTKTLPVTVINATLLAPTEGASFASGETFTAQARAVSSTTRVDYVVDGALIGSQFDAATLFKRDINLVNAGSRVVKAIAYNSAGVKLGEDNNTISITAATPSCTPPQTLQNGVCVTPTATCQFGAWSTYNGVNLRRHTSGAYIYKTANKQIDADGAPNAYHPADVGKTCSATGGLLGLDCPQNAGYPNGSFWRDVLAVDPNNNAKPYVQPSGAYAGYFVSMTSLSDRSKVAIDPTKYVSSTSVPYIVFPGNFNAKSGTGKVGDLGFAINLSNNKKTPFVVAETGPATANLGEMSIALASAMGGVNPNPINGAGAPGGTILYVSFPFSGNNYSWPMTNAQMQANVNTLLQSVGGEAGLLACQSLL
jgi:hypothetical protein